MPPSLPSYPPDWNGGLLHRRGGLNMGSNSNNGVNIRNEWHVVSYRMCGWWMVRGAWLGGGGGAVKASPMLDIGTQC
jgi:hypothetical protein